MSDLASLKASRSLLRWHLTAIPVALGLHGYLLVQRTEYSSFENHDRKSTDGSVSAMSEYMNENQRFPAETPPGVAESEEPGPMDRNESLSSSGGNGSQQRNNDRQPTQRLKKQAARVLADVRQSTHDMLNHEKNNMAVYVEDYGRAIQHAADTLGKSGETSAANRAAAIAQQIEGVADYLEDSDILELRDDIRDTASSRPGLFLAGMFLSGVAASQLLRSANNSSRIAGDRSEEATQPTEDAS
jgi:hypothetical protein